MTDALTPPATAAELTLTPPQPVAAVAPEKAGGMIAVDQAALPGLDSKVAAYVESLTSLDVHSPAFAAKDQQDRLARLIVESIQKSGDKHAEAGRYEQAATFYLRVPKETADAKVGSQAWMNAGVMYEKAKLPERAADIYIELAENEARKVGRPSAGAATLRRAYASALTVIGNELVKADLRDLAVTKYKEALLFLPPVTAGREPLALADLQRVAAVRDWRGQRRGWRELTARRMPAGSKNARADSQR